MLASKSSNTSMSTLPIPSNLNMVEKPKLRAVQETSEQVPSRLWSTYELDLLKRMWSEGAFSSEIAPLIGRSRSAVMGKVDRLGLFRKNNPDLQAKVTELKRPRTPRNQNAAKNKTAAQGVQLPTAEAETVNKRETAKVPVVTTVAAAPTIIAEPDPTPAPIASKPQPAAAKQPTRQANGRFMPAASKVTPTTAPAAMPTRQANGRFLPAASRVAPATAPTTAPATMPIRQANGRFLPAASKTASVAAPATMPTRQANGRFLPAASKVAPVTAPATRPTTTPATMPIRQANGRFLPAASKTATVTAPVTAPATMPIRQANGRFLPAASKTATVTATVTAPVTAPATMPTRQANGRFLPAASKVAPVTTPVTRPTTAIAPVLKVAKPLPVKAKAQSQSFIRQMVKKVAPATPAVDMRARIIDQMKGKEHKIERSLATLKAPVAEPLKPFMLEWLAENYANESDFHPEMLVIVTGALINDITPIVLAQTARVQVDDAKGVQVAMLQSGIWNRDAGELDRYDGKEGWIQLILEAMLARGDLRHVEGKWYLPKEAPMGKSW